MKELQLQEILQTYTISEFRLRFEDICQFRDYMNDIVDLFLSFDYGSLDGYIILLMIQIYLIPCLTSLTVTISSYYEELSIQ